MKNSEVETTPVALTIRSAARLLAVSPMTIRRLLDRGALIRVKIGRSVRVLARSVHELAESGGVAHE